MNGRVGRLRPVHVMAGQSAGTADAGERLLESMRPWVCAGSANDQLITLTEGVIPHEERGPPEVDR